MIIRPKNAPLLPGVILALFGTLIRPQRLHVSAVGPNSSDAFEDVNTAGLLRWAAARGLPTPPGAVGGVRGPRRWIWAKTNDPRRQLLTRDSPQRAPEPLGWPRNDTFLDE